MDRTPISRLRLRTVLQYRTAVRPMTFLLIYRCLLHFYAFWNPANCPMQAPHSTFDNCDRLATLIPFRRWQARRPHDLPCLAHLHVVSNQSSLIEFRSDFVIFCKLVIIRGDYYTAKSHLLDNDLLGILLLLRRSFRRFLVGL